jgi:cytochrome c oxidase subunit 2
MSKENARRFLIVSLLVIASTFLVYFFLDRVGLFPQAGSQQAVVIDRLFNVHLILISFLFSLISVFLGYSLIFFRRKPGEKSEGTYIKGNTGLEIIWTVIPLIAVVVISYFGAETLAETIRPDPQAMVVKVTGFQWAWAYEYPDFGITSQTLYLPVNKQVLFKMTSRDVIHSFWVPEWRVKQDVLPGENLVKELRVTPTQLGNFQVLCAELCGGAHAYMNSPVVVMTQEDFNSWVSKEVSSSMADPVARGEKWAVNNGCLGCHSIDGKDGVGPTWKGLFGSEVEWMDGKKYKVDENYIKSAILRPQLQMRKGYNPNLMPQTYGTLLTSEQIDDLIAYIISLK